jgi:hypothetical protein
MLCMSSCLSGELYVTVPAFACCCSAVGLQLCSTVDQVNANCCRIIFYHIYVFLGSALLCTSCCLQDEFMWNNWHSFNCVSAVVVLCIVYSLFHYGPAEPRLSAQCHIYVFLCKHCFVCLVVCRVSLCELIAITNPALTFGLFLL